MNDEAHSEVVWTGFEPFGDHVYNPSWDVAQAASKLEGPPASRAERLPVEFEYVARWVDRNLAGDQRRLAVHVGLAEGRSTINLESTARNSVGDRPDEAGLVFDADKLLADAEPRRTTPLEVDALVERLSREHADSDLPGAVASDDAGDYVCNALFFHALGCADALFVHVPPLTPGDARRVGRSLGAAVGELVGR